jgi:hypothetical protein
VLKGGILVAAIVGLDTRSTMYLDATFRGLPLTEEIIRKTITAICAFPIQDEVELTVNAIVPTRMDDVYGGYRVKITAVRDTIETPFMLDISTGDVITPRPITYYFHGILDDEKRIEVLAYNTETVIAEKIETILRRTTLNTRPRDFYDILILSRTQSYDAALLKEAVSATAAHRGTTEQIADIPALLKKITYSAELKQMWAKYLREFSYAAGISYERIIKALSDVCAMLL